MHQAHFIGIYFHYSSFPSPELIYTGIFKVFYSANYMQYSPDSYKVGHSPDPDDAFMFHAMTTGAINTHGRNYEHVLLDIETLNQHALIGISNNSR